jgi:hypothetical protein
MNDASLYQEIFDPAAEGITATSDALEGQLTKTLQIAPSDHALRANYSLSSSAVPDACLRRVSRWARLF